ncbi:TIGR02647 family protein [Marinobacter adhaerens]|uniref:TIGR02647 family protein n=1 Tax=Marinobacter adhaerens TaxID=1033846 RepID=A0A851HV75_9GAMM|nr:MULTISPECIES: TIGR02647 family protein [Marinobacter]NWN91182.1 TIGR02647 family protein [Marinobacter adhaerens]
MTISSEHIAELNLLSQFESSSGQAGIKVHQGDAPKETVQAAERLFAKGLITRDDGGYLTPLGSEAVELTLKLQSILTS